MARLLISLFGQFEVRLDRQPVTGFQSDKSRSLLAYLAVEADRPLRRELLAALFWPDVPDQTARTNLRGALLNLRQVLDEEHAHPPVLTVTREAIRFNLESDVQVDVIEFQRLQAEAGGADGLTPARIQALEEALGFYRGNFLEGLSLKDCQEFEDWCFILRERLRGQASAAYRLIGEYYERSLQYGRAIPYLRKQVELEPWQEIAHYHLMRLLGLNGERGAALAQYEICRRQLDEILGIAPAAETERLYALIRDSQLDEMRRPLGELLPAQGISPFKGLQFFEVGEAGLFFGREAVTLRLADHLRQMQEALAAQQGQPGQSSETGQGSGGAQVLAIVGASGSGKSSLVRAGLAALLKRGPESAPPPAGASWSIQIITPGPHPLAALNSLDGAPPGPALLVVDQFEELFTLCHNETEASEFLERLLGRPSLVVIALRADFYVHCSKYPALRQALSARQEFLGAMSPAELRRAIEEPARRNGWELEPGLADLILRDLGAGPGHSPEPGALPLLSLALLETWKRRSAYRLTLKGYEEAGSVSGVIAKTAETVFAGLDEEQQAVTRRVFLRLTELGEGAQDARRLVSLSELLPAGEQREMTLIVVRRLANARLLVTEWNPASEQDEVEMAHEALILHWPRLRAWLEENRAELRLAERVRDAAQEWQAGQRAENLLVHRGERLEAALQAAGAGRLAFNQVEQEYLNACRGLGQREDENREARRKRVMFGIAAVALALALAAFFALGQARSAQRQAEISLAQQLAAQAEEMMSKPQHNEMAVLLTIESLRHYPARNTNEILAHSLSLFPQTLARLRVDGRVTCLAVSPDGKWIAAGSADRTVRIWDAHSGAELGRLLHASSLTALAFSPDGTLLVSGDQAGSARVWEVSSGIVLSQAAGNGAVWSVSFNRDGSLAAAAGEDGILRLWQARSGKMLAQMAQAGIIYSLRFSPDGAVLLSAGQDHALHGWSAATGRQLFSLPTQGELWAADYSPDGHWIVSAGWDGVVQVWDARSLSPHSRMLLNDSTHAAVFNRDGSWLATASDDGTARVWDVENGRELARMQHSGRVRAIAFSPDGKRVVSGSDDGTARVWEAADGQEIARMQHSDAVTGVAFSPDGQEVISSSRDATLRVWQIDTGREVGHMQADGRISALSVGPDGSKTLAGSDDSTARVWDTASQAELARMLHGGSVFDAAFSPKGNLAISGSTDSTIRVWKTDTGQEIDRLKLSAIVWAVAFSPDGRQVLSGSQDNQVILWDLASGTEIRRMSHGGPVVSVTFSPDGKWAASAGQDRMVRVWELSDGRELMEKILDQAPTTVRFSSDGKLLAAGGQDRLVHVWDVSTWSEVQELKHDDAVTSLAFAPGGQWLISGSLDQSARIWEVRSGREMTRITLSAPVSVVNFSPDGKRAITGTLSGAVQFWVWQDADLIRLACSRLERNLSREEWQEFMGDRPYESTCPNLPPG